MRVCDDCGMETPTADLGGGRDLSFSGVVLMKGHPRHPVLHHHGLGELSFASDLVRLVATVATRNWQALPRTR